MGNHQQTGRDTRENLTCTEKWFLGWAIFWAFVEAAEFVCDDLHRGWWFAVVVPFVLLEFHGARTRRLGDTFSEMLWKITSSGTARYPLAFAVATALAVRAFSVPFLLSGRERVDYLPFGTEVFEWLPWALLCVGLAGWLTIHFATLGRKG